MSNRTWEKKVARFIQTERDWSYQSALNFVRTNHEEIRKRASVEAEADDELGGFTDRLRMHGLALFNEKNP